MCVCAGGEGIVNNYLNNDNSLSFLNKFLFLVFLYVVAKKFFTEVKLLLPKSKKPLSLNIDNSSTELNFISSFSGTGSGFLKNLKN